MNTKLAEILSRNECYITESEHGGEFRMTLYIPYGELEKIMTSDFKQYLSDKGGEFTATMLEDYIVIDLIEYIQDWLCEDVRSYLGYVTKFSRDRR